MAAEAGLAVATKSDSQDCFIPGGDNTFLKAYLDEQE
jgi:tRNA U34 2-thiouridine synthase MnmA/TrmU